jgi:magnesium chelatase subunit D
LLDRFGLTVEAAAPRDPAARAEVVRRRIAFDADPAAFAARFADQEAAVAGSIAAARARLGAVAVGDAALEQIAAVCTSFGVDGLRADIVIARAAAAHAAWRGAAAVTRDDIRVASRLALPHRRRRNPFDAPGLDEQQLDDALGHEPDDDPDPQPPRPGPAEDDGPGDHAPGEAVNSQANGAGTEPPGAPGPAERESVRPAGATFRPRRLEVPGKGRGTAGRRSRAHTDSGHTVGAYPPRSAPRDVHLTATLMASAPHQVRRGRTGPGLVLERADLRERRREGRESNLVLFVVDASGSMAARRRMEAVKGAVLSLLLDAYQRRDKVGLICFRGAGAQLLLPPTSSVDAAASRLENMPTGGQTPLAAGLAEAHATLLRERLRDPLRRPLLVVVTDGRHTAGGEPDAVALRLRRDGIAAVVVDCEAGPVRLGLAGVLARNLGAFCLGLHELSVGTLAGSVRAYRDAVRRGAACTEVPREVA